MKKIAFILILIFAIALPSKAKRIVKVAAFNFYPGIFQDTDGKVKGFYVDALNEIGKKENIEFVYVYGTWNQGLERINTGEVDILTSVAYSEERAVFMDYASEPILTVWSEVYVALSSDIHGILDLNNKKIAVMKADMNGKNLQQLANKLNVNCTFIETSDFQEVFNKVASGETDAGVVNNTFGASKYQDSGLQSSGIVFNPFDIFFTVRKNQNKDLLDLLSKYLVEGKHRRNSVFNVARQKWSHGIVGKIQVFPDWLNKAIYSILGLLVVLTVFIFLLRYQVKIATRKVKSSEALFKVFMENTPGFVYIKDENLNHIYQNKMVDYAEKSHNSKALSSAKSIFEPHIAQMLEDSDRKILNGEEKQLDIQYSCSIKNQERWLHDYKFYLQLPNEKSAIGGISFDISGLKQTEEALILAKERAEQSDRLKSAFLSNMSHEIRTPLNSIIGFSELLNDPAFDVDQKKEFIHHISTSGNNLLNIISDIMDVSKIESGDITIRGRQLNIQSILTNIISANSIIALEKQLELRYNSTELEFGSEIFVYADPERLIQIFNNLIGNALKFTFKGYIQIGFRTLESMVEFFVKDTGVGISPEYHEHIFERFRQVESTFNQNIGGNGLGLTISKNLVELMGGKIWVESEVGIGTTFYFTLPLSPQLNSKKNPQYI